MPGPGSHEEPPLGDLAGLTGRGVRVAVIDSGVDLPGVEHREGGADPLGHGTAVARVVRLWAPEATLLSARVFHRRLRCPASRAQEALRWAVRQGADVALLSLAGPEARGWPQALAEAADAGTIVVAAAANRSLEGYPACLQGALGVASSGAPGLFRLPRAAGPLDLEAPPVPGPSGRGAHRGTSLAAAHAAGLVARVRQAEPGAGLERVRERLAGLF